MLQNQFSFTEFGFSSQIIRDLIDQKSGVSPFIADFFSIEALAKQARAKVFSQTQRSVLVNALKDQNKAVSLSAKTTENIKALNSKNTVTITTGHQLNLLTGPLYSIYKVAQIIALCKAMNKKDTEFNYVPVFWMATEDHDFEEINHINLFGNKIEWNKKGQENRIVGEVEPIDIADFTNAIEDKYNEESLKKEVEKLTGIYKSSINLAAATRQLMNQLFGEYGLVIIDGNDLALKKSFIHVAQKEIKEDIVFKAVTATNQKLEILGYHNQVFVRECNLFYIDENGKRERIIKEGINFLYGGKQLSADEIEKELIENPQNFSPNALLRPVYQELILPNLAYIGGGGEIAYWLQLKTVFDALEIEFPLLRVRDSILLLRNKEINDLQDLKLSVPDLKQGLQALVKEIALKEVTVEIELNTEVEDLNRLKKNVLEKAITVNKGMVGMIEAEFTKMRSSIDRIESKLIKAEKAKHEQKAKKIQKLQAKIYPKGGFQERYENFLPYFLADAGFISKIVDNLTAADEPKIKIVEI